MFSIHCFEINNEKYETSSHETDLALLLEIMYCARNLEIYLLADN